MRHLSSKTAQLGWAVVAAFLLVAPSPALAAETPKPAAAVCPATSLLAGLAPLAPLASPAPATPAPFRGSGSILTDGRIAPEGGVWDSELAFRMAAAETVVTFDIGSEATVRSLLVQADANDSYLVEGSMDGVGFVRVG